MNIEKFTHNQIKIRAKVGFYIGLVSLGILLMILYLYMGISIYFIIISILAIITMIGIYIFLFYPMYQQLLSTEKEHMELMELRKLVDKDRLIYISMKEAQYLALQNQINPHFLYNTLEGIRSEALIAGLDSVAEMTESLATFFRYTISHLDRLVTLEDELENIENYYYIQQFRFGEKLHLSIVYDCDEEISKMDILNYCIPKLTLQPIVENSIYHGIEKKVGKGHLIITIGKSDKRLWIRVSDDGAGMEEEKLLEINKKLKKLSLEGTENKKGGIAIVNVNNRIKLLFGEEYGIYVYSNKGSGTDVEINLPLVRK